MTDQLIASFKLTSIQHALVKERFIELQDVIRLVSLRPHLTLTLSKTAPTWSFNFSTQQVTAPLQDLLEHDFDYCRGLALHEAAHATTTRLFDLISPDLIKRPEIHSLLNSIEDCRIETWIMARNPGAIPWVKAYNTHLFTPILEGKCPTSHVAQYTLSILSYWWFDQIRPDLHPDVHRCFLNTQRALDRAIQCQPPRIHLDLPLIRSHYEQSQTLYLNYHQLDSIHPPSDFECLIRIRQLQMLQIVFDSIMPSFNALIEHDRNTQDQKTMNQELKQMLDLLRGHHLVVSSQNRFTQSDHQSSSNSHTANPELIQQPSADSLSLQFNANEETFAPTSSLDLDQLRQKIMQSLDVDPQDVYLKAWKRLEPFIEKLADELIRIFQQIYRCRWINGFASGARLDLRQAMQFEGRPQNYTSLWQRKTSPHKIDPAFILLLDRSGSMHGELIQGAFDGLVLLSEVCARLDIPLEVFSFSDDVTHNHRWRDSLDHQARSTLGKLLQSTGGGTHLASALKKIKQTLSTLPFKQRYLIVLSDGEPNYESQVHTQIRQLEYENVTCIGLGIGPHTHKLKRFFQDGLYEISIEDVATELALLLQKILTQAI
jgi:uncharacterized protein with von Willebrand factor type A (vWA) domain